MLPFSLEALAKKLKLARKNSRMTQTEISEILEIKRNLYAKYETGKCAPSLAFVYSFSELFNIPTDVLLNPDIPTSDILKYH